MKKTVKTVNTTAKKSTTSQKVLVNPKKQYTEAEVRTILGFGAKTHVCPSKNGISVRKGKVAGADVIAYLESGSCRKAKIGRKYASGSVSVVAR